MEISILPVTAELYSAIRKQVRLFKLNYLLLAKIESGKVSPSIYIVYKIAKVLNTSIDNLVN